MLEKDTKFQLWKMNEFCRFNVLQSDYGKQYCIAYLKFAKRVDLKSSHYIHTHIKKRKEKRKW